VTLVVDVDKVTTQSQCRIKVGAIDAAALGPFKKQAHGHVGPYDKKKSLLYIGCDFSDWYIFGEIVKIVASRRHILKLKCTKFDFRWGSPRHRWGACSAPQTPRAGFKWAYF